MKKHVVENFTEGLVTAIEARSLKDGAMSDSNNWQVSGDKVELRRGYYPLGDKQAGSGEITGLVVAKLPNGTEIPFRAHGRKLEYYDVDTDTWTEIGSNVLPTAANGEDISMEFYSSLAGYMVYVSSPNSSIYKIMVANPGSITDLNQTTFRGRISIKQNRMFLWQRKGDDGAVDNTGLYGSYIDKDEISDYTAVTSEALAGVTGTLAFKSGNPLATCFGLVITDGTETFTDNYDGTLTGDLGGTGTINYTTGAFSLSFAGVPGSITADYYYEDSTTGTAIVNFSKSSPRTAGQGFVVRQDDGGGALQMVASLNDKEYCLHEKKTWVLTLSQTDTDATNLIFRNKVGIPNWRGAVETGDGIYYVDDSDENEPVVRLLKINEYNTEVLPQTISAKLNLADYRFNKAAMVEWGNYIVLACRHKDSDSNNTVFMYNRKWASWEKHDFWASCFAIYNGALIAGDSVQNNVYTLFSGLDDDESLIPNNVDLNDTNLGETGLKRMKRLVVHGEIGPDQTATIYASVDKGGFVEMGSLSGDGAYVDKSQSIAVGALTIGHSEVGGGSVLTGNIVAHNYVREITSVVLERFEYIVLRVVATGIGYLSVRRVEYKDIRDKGQKVPIKYR